MKILISKQYLLRLSAAFLLSATLGLADVAVTGTVSSPAWAHGGGSGGGSSGGGGSGGESSSTRPARNPHRDVRLAAAALVQAVRTMREAQEALDLLRSGSAADLFENYAEVDAVASRLNAEIRTARAQAHGAIQALTTFLARVGFTDPKSRLKGSKLSRAHTRAAAARNYSVIGNLVNEAKKGLDKLY